MTHPQNTLYYGDNLDILRRYIKDDSIDLVYLDPPFNSNADYNVLFAEHSTEKSHAQIQAFADTWQWDTEAARNFTDAVQNGGEHVAKCLLAFKTFLGQSDMLAYLSMMAPRLVELRRALKPTGSIYLHCDPTASHYLKMLMDSVFGPEHFGSEIIWKRSAAHSDAKQGRQNYGHIHDVILFFSKSSEVIWNTQFTPYDESYTEAFYKYVEQPSGRRYRMGDLTAAKAGGDTRYEWRIKRKLPDGKWEADLTLEFQKPQPDIEYKGVLPYGKRIWAYSKDNMRKYAEAGRIVYASTGMPNYKRYLDEMPGVPLQDMWTDIPPIPASSAERLGYPTQKPEQLLERILQVGTKEGDTVLDPFCGCGTTIAAAQKLNRNWIGIDITHLAVNLIKVRLADSFGKKITGKYKVVGEPEDLESAKALAEADKYQFQYWALGLIGARPAPSQEKKGADKGIDGHLYITDSSGDTKTIIISVKGGHVSVPQLRDLRGVVEREDAAIGVFICIEKPTKPMFAEAADAGFYENKSGVGESRHPRLQILTIEDLLNGKRLDLPLQQDLRSFKQAPKSKPTKSRSNPTLDFTASED